MTNILDLYQVLEEKYMNRQPDSRNPAELLHEELFGHETVADRYGLQWGLCRCRRRL